MPDTDLVRAFTFANAHERTKAYPAPAAVAPVTWFKRLPGAPLLPLPRKLPAPDSTAQDWLSRVAVLCSYTTGILRRELHAPYVYHRGIASPRTLHPTELYIWVPVGANGEPGLYHYLPLQHALEQVRSAECDASVRAALGAESAGVDLAVFVASDFWRVAHLYGDFALRLTALEAGQAVENLALLGHELGWVSRVQGFFDEAALGECLGLELEAEGILAAVCFAASGDRADHPVTAPVSAPPIAPLRQRWQHTSGVPLSESCAQLRAMQRQAAAVKAPARRHNTESEVADALSAVAAPTAEALPLPAAPPGQRPDLRTLIQRRHSGNEYEGLLGRPDPISLATMGEILRQTPGPWAGSDLAGVIPDPYIV
ncbi:MAG: oxidase, partial [Firmicutes bacterium]|nr:oxidase [Bacillota bacterium]